MSVKKLILRSFAGPLVYGLLPFSRRMAEGYVPLARKLRLLNGTRFDVYLRQLAVKLATLCLLACASLTSADTLVVDENNHRGWAFFANPAVTAAGEAPIVGIGDHAGGAASLNFSLNADQDKSSRNARLLKSDFPAAGLKGIKTLRDLSSISWQVHHSDPGNYPKFVVWVEVPITDDGVSEPEAIYFRPQNQAVKLREWDVVEVDLVNSKFTNNGVTTDGEKSTGTFAQWLEVIGGYDIYEIGIQYNNGNNSYTSYIDYIEINGTTFDFEASPPLPPSAPTDLVATPGDGQLDIAFTPAEDNGTAITDYQYQRDGGSWISAGTIDSPITIPDLTNGKDYAVRLRAISAAGDGEEAQILAAPRGTVGDVKLLVTSDNLRGFRLAGFTSDYVQARDNVGIDDGSGGASASINASLEGQGADRWGLFLDPKQFKGDQISQGGRKADRLQDLTSLSYRVWHDGEGYYPKLGFQMAREAPTEDGKTIAQLDLKMDQMPSLNPGWNTVEIKFDESPFTISYLSEGETSEKKTLSEWIAQYGDRRINLFRWQTGDGRVDRFTTQETYVDYIEVNGVTYDFEGTLPEVPDECSSADWAVVEASDASKQAFRCVADEAVYEYADFHVLTTTGNGADICQSSLPINVNNQNNSALFCQESSGVVRAIFDWDNRSIEPGGQGIRLTWLNTVSHIGSREKGGTACGSAGETVAGRCANQLAHGLRAFVDMAGAGGPAIAALDISNLTTLRIMFAKASQFNEDISHWDTSAITTMEYMFQYAKAFNQDLPWDTSAVENMNEMFRGASVFNGDVSLWQTGLVTNMNYMFREATAFNQNIGTWDTANVTGMYNMFHKAKAFNQNIGQWDTGKVTTMHRMFDRAESFNQDLSKWNIENVTANSDFDALATAWCGKTFSNNGRPIGITPQLSDSCLADSVSECSAVGEDEWALAASDATWVCKVAGQEYEYADFHVLTTNGTDVCANAVEEVPTEENDGQGLFCSSDGSTVRAIYDWDNAYDGEKAPITLAWLTSVEQIGSRSGSCSDEIKTVAGRCAKQLTSGKSAFRGMFGEGGVGIRNLNIDNLISLEEMFYGARGFNEDVTGWDISHVENLRRLFEGTNFDRNIGDWNTSAVTNMEATFYNTPFNQDISDWDTSQVERMGWMFQKATQFDQDISRWNTSKVRSMRSMFQNTAQFNQNISTQPVTGKNGEAYTAWDVSAVTNMAYMFEKARAFNQDLSGWNVYGVTNYSSFDEGADDWCGLGFNNRGRPSDWVPIDTVGCLNVVLQAPPSSSVGDEFDYVVQYYNQSERDLINGALTLVVPAGMTISHAGNGDINGAQVTWAGVDVLAGSSADGAGGERRVGVTVDAGTADGAALEASAILSDGAATTVNDIARTVISAKPVLVTQISASQQVAPGEVIQYVLSVSNEGQSTATGGDVTLSFEGDAPFTIQDRGSAICATATSCSWSGDLSSQDTRSQTVQVRVGTTAISGQTLRASVSASASNDVADEGNTASVTTEISALPLPALSLGLTTQPQGVLRVGEQFVAFFDMTNTGKGAAESITATLDIPNDVAYVGGVAGGGEGVYDATTNSVTWTLPSLAPSASANFGVTLKAPEVSGGIILKVDAATQNDGQQITASDDIALNVTGDAVLDLQLSLVPSEQVLPGDALEIALQFQNIGSDTAFSAVLDTETPADTTLLAWPDYAQCTTGGAGGECTVGYAGEMRLPLGGVEAKENAVANIQVLVSEVTQAAKISAAATLTGTDRDGEALAPQAASESVSVAAVNEVVLTVSQQADRQTAAPGQAIVYEITYQNGGNSDVSNAVLAGELPADTRLLNLSGNTLTDDSDGGTTTWRLPLDTLAPFDSGMVRLEVEVKGNAELGTSLNNQVTLSAADDTERAEAALVKVVPGGAAVLESSIGNPEATVPGGSFNYALYYANTGTLAAASTPLQMQVEKGLTVTECDGCTTQTENDTGVLLSWSLGSVEVGSGTKQISVTVDPSVAANSELHAISYIGEPQNGSRATGTVSGKLDAQRARRRAGEAGLREAPSSAELEGPLGLSVITVGEQDSPALGDLMIAAPDRALAGDQVAVSVSFANKGSAGATNVTLSTTVPTHSAVNSVEGGVCSATPCQAGDTITWAIGDVSAGSTRTVSYALTIDGDAADEVIQHRVALDSAESLEESASAQTAVLDAILSIAIGVADAGGANAEATYVSAGDTLTYSLTLLNDSAVAQSNLTVVNQLPPLIAACGAACVSGDASGAAVDAEAGTLTWSGINLDPDSDVSLDYQVVIPAGMADNTALVNSVSVSKSARLSDSDSATVTVSSKAALSVSMTAPAVLQDGAQGSLTLTARNTGTVGTAATLRYVLPSNATMIDNAGASVSGAAYTWSLDNLAPDVSDSRVITIAAAGAADTTLLHTATATGIGTSDSTEARTVIGVREELALSLTAPASADTDTGFTASLSAQNTGNAAANGTIVTLTLPTGFTATDPAGGTLDSQVIRWTLDLAANATQTLSPTIMAPTAPDTGVLLGGLTAISGKTQSASATVRVTAPAAAMIQASAQFSVVEAMAGETVSLSAGPTNIGDAAAGMITNIVTLASGLAPLETSGATWSSTDRTLRWTTPSLAAQASDLKRLTLQVEEAGPLSADVSSGGATSTATMVRATLEKVTMQPIARESNCKLSGRPIVQAAPTPPDGMTLALANAVGFSVIDCGRDPNTDYPERMRITIDMGGPIPADAQLYKIADSGAWSRIAAADIEGQTVTYTLSDDGELDQDQTPGRLRDPVALAFPYPGGGEASPVLPVPLPLWLFALLSVLIGGLGYRRLNIA